MINYGNNTYDIIGVVEDINDPMKKGCVKIRIERIHGRADADKKIPTEDLPWYEPYSRGTSFYVPKVGTVVYVVFNDDEFYMGRWVSVEHYNINLQKKAESLSDADYQSFYATTFNDKHQYYHTDSEGIKFDYVKSNMNFKPNGDINFNLRDNKSELNIGTEDATQQAMLGNHWLEDFFDEFVNNLLGMYGGPYIGNLTAPVLPHPKMIEVLNKYLAYRNRFISKHVRIVDNDRVKEQNRDFDISQDGDNYTDESLDRRPVASESGYQPEERPKAAETPEGIPNEEIQSGTVSASLPDDATPEEQLRNVKPFSDYDNGRLPLENLTVNKYLAEIITDPDDERKYLIAEASDALDNMLDKFYSEKDPSWADIKCIMGYVDYERQENMKKQLPTLPKAGTNPFGFANQVHLYFEIDRSDEDMVSEATDIVLGKNTNPTYNQTKTLLWLVQNAGKYKFQNIVRTRLGNPQWWHWLYNPNS